MNPLIFTAINVAPSLPNSKLSHCSIDTNTFHECGLYFTSTNAICFLTDPFAVKLELSQMVHFCAFCFSCTYALWAFNFPSTAKLLLHMVHLWVFCFSWTHELPISCKLQMKHSYNFCCFNQWFCVKQVSQIVHQCVPMYHLNGLFSSWTHIMCL